MRTRGWRRIGTVIVRWPGPILVVTLGIALIGLLALPGYKTSYDARPYLPATAPAIVGYAAAERHFSEARLNPELLMIETDHDMRNPADMLILERVAKAVLHTSGVALVQSITRPLGTPINHSSIPFQISAQSASQIMNLATSRPGRRYSEAGRRDQQHDRHPRQQLTLQKASAPRPTSRPRRSTTPSTIVTTCATRSPTSTTSSGRCATTSTGNRTVSTSRCARR